MILFQNALIKLDYNPATDILAVDMPSVHYNLSAEFKRALDIILENIRNYDVKKLLVDATKSVIEMDPEEYLALVTGFSHEIKTTRLQQVARVVSGNKVRENIVQQVVNEVQPVLLFKTFRDVHTATDWLVK